jgi:hypothetical protein
VVTQGGTDTTYAGLALQELSAVRTGSHGDSWKIRYLYDEYGKPYGGIYTDSTTTPVFFVLVTTDRGDVVGQVWT